MQPVARQTSRYGPGVNTADEKVKKKKKSQNILK
jgi:hypothetical protein